MSHLNNGRTSWAHFDTVHSPTVLLRKLGDFVTLPALTRLYEEHWHLTSLLSFYGRRALCILMLVTGHGQGLIRFPHPSRTEQRLRSPHISHHTRSTIALDSINARDPYMYQPTGPAPIRSIQVEPRSWRSLDNSEEPRDSEIIYLRQRYHVAVLDRCI